MTDSKYRTEYEAFDCFIRGKPIPPRAFAVLVAKSFLALFEGAIRNMPGGFGYKIRYYYYKLFLKRLGKNVLIDVGVFLNGPANISIGDYTWIDTHCRIEAHLGEIQIGKRVHIAAMTIIGAREPVIIGDYVGIASGVKIYANSEHPAKGKRMSGPMVPEEMKAFHSKPITLEKDSFVGANSVLLPGARLGEGAVVGANCVISKAVKPYDIVVAPFGRRIRTRDTVTMPDL
jgi:galactoside O-acetyltransferase